MTKARKLGVCTPMLYIVGPVLHTLTFEYVEGPSVKDVFLEFGSRDVDKECMDNIASQIGHAIGKLHDCGLVHGDLTTSNILKEWYQSVGEFIHVFLGPAMSNYPSFILCSMRNIINLCYRSQVDFVYLCVLERAILSMHSSCGNVVSQLVVSS